jgi:hypothetical protein
VVFIGVVSTETEISFFEKGVRNSKNKFQNQKKIKSEFEFKIKNSKLNFFFFFLKKR